MQVTTLGWTLTIAVIVGLLALDLALGTIRPHAVGFREATAWSVFYIAVAIAFGFVLAGQHGWGYGAEYFAGYIVEKSLSVDNLFIFVSTGLAIILAFIGLKLILHWGHGINPQVPEIATPVSLVVIIGVLTVTTIASLVKSRNDPTQRAHAGVVIGHPTRSQQDQPQPGSSTAPGN